ncbi:MAG: GumC family protein [Terriglobales bacterium]
MHSHQVAPSTAAPIDVWSLPSVNGPEDSGGTELPISYYWALIRRQRWKIAAFVLILTTAATLFTLTRPKKYDATVMLRVDPLSSPIVGETQRNGQVDPNLLVSTEAKAMVSPAVVQETIDRLGLAAVPEFARFATIESGGQRVPAPAKLLNAVTKQISVSQPVETELLQVTFRSLSPQLSASVANGLAAQFLEHQDAVRAQSLTDSSKSMVGQLDTMRAQMEKDEEALVDYEASNDVIDAGDKTNIYEARLTAINQDLGKAQSARMELEAEYRVVMQGGVDAILASPLGEQLLPREQRLINDQHTLASYATIYGPRHPLYKQQEEAVQHDKESLQQGADLIRQQVQDLYSAALTREALIAAGLQQQKQAFDAFNLRAIKYHALQAAATSSTNLYYDLQQRIQDATVAAGLRSEEVAVISPATPPNKPSAPHPFLVGALTLLMTTVIGVGAAVLVGLMDRTVGTADDVELRFRVQVLGSLPDVAADMIAAGLVELRSAGPDTSEMARHLPYREAVYSVYSAVQFADQGIAGTLAVTSSVPGEGKSTLTSYLAAISAALGRRTIIVDADLRKPTVHRIHNIANRVGVSSVLRGTAPLSQAVVSPVPNLFVLPAGPLPPNPTELLHLGLGALLEELQSQYDWVLIDCPPLLGFGDSVKLASTAQGVLLVARVGLTQQAHLSASLHQIKSVRAHLLGVVLNRVGKDVNQAYGYYQSYYYGREEGEEESQDAVES